MGKLARFTIFFLGCALLAAILAPWIYLGMKELSQNYGWTWAKELARHPFHRYFHRVFQVSVVLGAGIFLMKGWMPTMSGSYAKALGLRGGRPVALILVGFISSILFLSAYSLFGCMVGWQKAKVLMSFGWYMDLTGGILLTAFVVALIEELFFRGYFYQMCMEEVGRFKAMVIQLLFFSFIHYIKPPKAEDLGVIHWGSGFQMLGLAFQRLGDFHEIIGGILVLMMVAWILCWTLEKTGNIYLAIGLHAGWIFVLQMSSELTEVTSSSMSFPQWVLGAGNVREGVVVLVPLLIQFLVLKRLLGSESRKRK